MPCLRLAVLAIFFGLDLASAQAQDAGCRSVHLFYEAPPASVFANEVTVRKSANGTYFAVCGWSGGYFGLQQLEDGRKLVIFSVWDPALGDDPASVPVEKQVRALFAAPGVRVQRFGNEGTGGQSFFDFPWQPNVTYRFAVTARPDGPTRTAYTGYFYLPATKKWKRLVTFSTLTRKNEGLRELYSFVEDFARTAESARQKRHAIYGNGWLRSATKDWTPIEHAQFTADANPSTNIDAGPAKSGFFLSTGGRTPKNADLLNQTLRRPAAADPVPHDLSKLR